MGQYFGTDGVRGVANAELTPELAVGIGRALVRTLREEGTTRARVLIGRDPRASGEMLGAALTAGICSAGGDALQLGVLPTPGVAYLCDCLDADAGVMISASHNPVQDNGIKIFGPNGFKLKDTEEDRLEELLQIFDEDRPVGVDIGRERDISGAVEVYQTHVIRAADGADLSGLHVVVDCANGSASEIAPAVLRRLGAKVTAVGAVPDGTNINHRVGSTHPQHLIDRVAQNGADVGIAHDGDADRLIACTAEGKLVDGDHILAILAQQRKQTVGLDGVVATVMSNLGFMQAMERLDIPVHTTAVGDRYVLEEMLKTGWVLGGEQSGHIISRDHATTGDGILSAVLLLSAMVNQGKSLAELATVMTSLPQVLINVKGVDKDQLDDCTPVWEAVTMAEERLSRNGRVLLRKSGTEPLVRVMVEADTAERAQSEAEALVQVVRDSLPAV